MIWVADPIVVTKLRYLEPFDSNPLSNHPSGYERKIWTVRDQELKSLIGRPLPMIEPWYNIFSLGGRHPMVRRIELQPCTYLCMLLQPNDELHK